MWMTFKFVVGFVYRSIRSNFLRSLTVLFSIILILSATVAMLGWLEASPEIVIDSTFEKRGYEIQISEIYYQEDQLSLLQEYLETESLVESTSIIHKSMFLYNLEGRNPNLSVIDPPASESDFYISKDDLSDGVFFVPDDYLEKIQLMLEFEEGSTVSFNNDDSGIIISRRMLKHIEENTDHTYEIGSTIDFSIATQFLPDLVDALWGLQPYAFEDLTINAIFDRMPTQTQSAFGLEFYQETLGDGMFVSHDLLIQSLVPTMEGNGFFPTLFVRVDRQELAQLRPSQVVPQIDHLASRIKLQGRLNVDVQAQEMHSVLFYFDQSRVVLLLLLLPFLILAEIFYLALVPHLLNNRIEEFYYLRLRGTTDTKIFSIQGVEFGFLTLVGTIFGFLGGTIFLDVLLAVGDFLVFTNFAVGSGLSMLIETQSGLWIIGVIVVILLNYFYVLARFGNIIRRLQQLEGVTPSSRVITSSSVRRSSLRILLGGLIIYLMFTIIGPIILSEFGTSGLNLQLVPIVSIFLIIIWIFFSFYAPQFCLQVIQSFFESIKVFTNPRRRLTWLNLFRRRAQYLSFLALLTLTISLLSFTLVYFETIQENNNKNATYVNGGDLKVITSNVNVGNFTNLVESINGVGVCVGFPHRDVTIGDYSFRLIGVNPNDYYNISSLYSLSVIKGPPSNRLWYSLNERDENESIPSGWEHNIIMNQFLADLYKWDVGSIVSALGILPGYNARYDFSIKAIIDSAPGIGPLYMGGISKGTYTFGGFAIVHEDFLTSFGNEEANTFLIRINSPNQLSSVINELKKLDSVRTIYTPNSVLEYQQNFLKLAGVQGILSLNFLGAILISLIGIAVFYQYLVAERLNEFAVFQAFGATKRRISYMAFIESLFLIILGLVLGVLTGNFFALGFLILSRSITVGPYNVFLLELTLDPIVLASTLAIVTLVIIIAAAIPLKKVYSLQITNILRGE